MGSTLLGTIPPFCVPQKQPMRALGLADGPVHAGKKMPAMQSIAGINNYLA